MDLNPAPSDARLQDYYLDTQFNNDDTVTHVNTGPLATVCRGTWKNVKRLESSHGRSVVWVQRLVQPTTDDQPKIPPAQPKIYRAVKQLRSHQPWPAMDYWPMISRGILCMVMANVSDTIAIARLLGWYRDRQFTYIAMEYYPPGNLQKYLEASPCQEQPWARDVIRQVLGVLIELETSQMAHRNLTLSNIVISSPLPIRVKVTDFYNAKWMSENNGLVTQVGSHPYVAPEMHRNSDDKDGVSTGYDTKIDMWALGIILHQILSGSHPFHEPGRRLFSERQYQRFLDGDGQVSLDAVHGMINDDGMMLLAAMLARDPKLRPTPAQALGTPWFTAVF